MTYNPYLFASALGLNTVSYTSVGPLFTKLLAAADPQDVTFFDRATRKLFLSDGSKVTVDSDRISLEAPNQTVLAKLTKFVTDTCSGHSKPFALRAVQESDASVARLAEERDKAVRLCDEAQLASKKRQERIDELTREKNQLMGEKLRIVGERDAQKRFAESYRSSWMKASDRVQQLEEREPRTLEESPLVKNLRELNKALEMELAKVRAEARGLPASGTVTAQSQIYYAKLKPADANDRWQTQTLEACFPILLTRALQGTRATTADVKMNHDTGKGELTIHLETIKSAPVKETGYHTLELRF